MPNYKFAGATNALNGIANFFFKERPDGLASRTLTSQTPPVPVVAKDAAEKAVGVRTP